ncbi:lipid kinase YegS [Shewanella sp. UCD-KL12]|uniref:lipid kinase YegS n=1 Tax=Shewanella sp. UCD-KL12 TaxID=1917163 RepID=UPI0009711522|nr:lipid kinase YegS [Shewanella sp. UCD-KL12]
MKIRLLLNGKKAGLDTIRQAVYSLRSQGHFLEVRVTWEAGDIERLVAEAIADGCDRIIAGGGDGTVNEVANALMLSPLASRPELAILPLGTANDFATACTISNQPLAALQLAATGEATPIDIVSANEQYFINMATGGFGAQVTATTPVQLKNFLGGGAYTLTGLIQALNFQPFLGTVSIEGQNYDRKVLFGAVCNGRMAGGGQELAKSAYINDGLLELVSLQEFPASELSLVINELINDDIQNGQYVKRHQATAATWQSAEVMPINLDGEPLSTNKLTVKVIPEAINLVLPTGCPLIKV